jgi:hypothetical protein
MGSSFQQTEMTITVTLAVAALGTLILSLAGRWIGGVWTTLLATLAACLFAYKPLLSAPLFGNVQHDLLQRILTASIPFTVCLIGLSFKRISFWFRLLFAVVAPSLLLYWVFLHFDIAMPRWAMLTHEILPVAVAVLIAWLLIEPISVRSPGPAAPMILGFVTGGVAFLLLISQENQAGEFAPLIPATAGGAMIAAIINSFVGKKPLGFARGPVLQWLMLSAALFAFMWFDTDALPVKPLLIIASTLPAAWAAEIGPIHRWKPWKRESLRFLLLAVPVIIAVVLAYQQSKQAGDFEGM